MTDVSTLRDFATCTHTPRLDSWNFDSQLRSSVRVGKYTTGKLSGDERSVVIELSGRLAMRDQDAQRLRRHACLPLANVAVASRDNDDIAVWITEPELSVIREWIDIQCLQDLSTSGNGDLVSSRD